ncbi:Uncharacterised protein [Candidatus Tiddalikarchaeum anstoanum]|nr:Uncharacterised protein [Candidatus Tiddalikarchaeum anstoanum]
MEHLADEDRKPIIMALDGNVLISRDITSLGSQVLEYEQYMKLLNKVLDKIRNLDINNFGPDTVKSYLDMAKEDTIILSKAGPIPTKFNSDLARFENGNLTKTDLINNLIANLNKEKEDLQISFKATIDSTQLEEPDPNLIGGMMNAFIETMLKINKEMNMNEILIISGEKKLYASAFSLFRFITCYCVFYNVETRQLVINPGVNDKVYVVFHDEPPNENYHTVTWITWAKNWRFVDSFKEIIIRELNSVFENKEVSFFNISENMDFIKKLGLCEGLLEKYNPEQQIPYKNIIFSPLKKQNMDELDTEMVEHYSENFYTTLAGLLSELTKAEPKLTKFLIFNGTFYIYFSELLSKLVKEKKFLLSAIYAFAIYNYPLKPDVQLDSIVEALYENAPDNPLERKKPDILKLSAISALINEKTALVDEQNFMMIKNVLIELAASIEKK